VRYSKETIRAKIEWEGTEGITWFRPYEVPEEFEELYANLLQAYDEFNALMDDLMDVLDED
jgi:hypothetical protein